jgi:hypothetical protein
MAYGDCDGPWDAVPWPRWLGIRTTTGAASMSWLMVGDTAHTDTTYQESTPGLEFGVVIFAVQEQAVVAPPGFEVVRAFLEDHEIEVKPWGINAFGIVQLRERPFWQFFEWLGYAEKEITLQGYVGVNNSMSVGFGASSASGGQVDRSMQQEFLNLRAALPARTPPLFLKHLFKQMHWELEIVLQDTLQATTTTREGHRGSGQIDLLLNVNHVLELSDDAVQALRLNPGATLVSTTGLDFGKEWKKWVGQPAEIKLVRKYELDGTWPLGAGFVIGHPTVEMDVTLTGESKGDWTVSLSGAIGWGEEEQLGVLGFTLGNKKAERLFEGSYAIFRQQSERKIAEIQTELSGLEAQMARGAANAAEVEYARKRLADEQKRLEEIKKEAENLPPVPSSHGSGRGREWTWVFRASFGNLSLVDLLALTRSVGGAVAGRGP